jgi:hypothetical protein
VENKGKLILIEIFPSVQKHDIQKYPRDQRRLTIGIRLMMEERDLLKQPPEK